MDFDFSLILVAITVATGIIWGGYLLLLRNSSVESPVDKEEPLIVETARSFFPIVLIVLVLRSFIVEPFRIPSGSMLPTLLIGDFILVNKFIYGIRLPVIDKKIIDISEPERGDVVVFRYPKQPAIDYIKRVVGLPGDRVAYYNKQLYINGQRMKQIDLGRYQEVGERQSMTGAEIKLEDLKGFEHNILIESDVPSSEGVYVIPEGQYFVMGDNRDNSNDSRFWGPVPEENLVGKAFFVWLNLDWDYKEIGFHRIGTLIK